MSTYETRVIQGIEVPQNLEAIQLLIKMHWLMKDIAEKKAYTKAQFNISETIDATKQPNQHFCGTSACVVGFAAIAGIFDGIMVKTEKYDGYCSLEILSKPGFYYYRDLLSLNRDYNIPKEIWDSFIYDVSYTEHTFIGLHIIKGKIVQAKHAAQRLKEILQVFYDTRVDMVPIPDRPWLGTEKAFP